MLVIVMIEIHSNRDSDVAQNSFYVVHVSKQIVLETPTLCHHILSQIKIDTRFTYLVVPGTSKL